MIISRTPFRVSFFGGGTDYPAWYREHGGAVLATSINRYCYISCRRLPPFFDYKHRIVYSKVETAKDTSGIQHPAVRGVFNALHVEDGVEIHHDADLPARSGLGSSSTFTVGMIHAIKALDGKIISKRDLAREGIHVEQEVIKECVGLQDTITAAYGGFNKIVFNADDTFDVSPLITRKERKYEFQNSLMLFFTGFSRYAAKVAAEQVKNMKNRTKQLNTMHQMVDQAISIITDHSRPIEELGKLLDDAWQLKRSLAESVSNPAIDEIYQAGINAGATGGKLLGAGGGGFILFFVKPGYRQKLLETFKHLIHVTFRFETTGSKIMVYESDDFS